jgi:predicted nucleic acid-binding protein
VLADVQILVAMGVHGLTLITHKVRDFKGIPNLRIEDWMT